MIDGAHQTLDFAEFYASEADQKALRVIYRLFINALVGAVKDRPTAAVLSEARHTLKDAGWVPSLTSLPEAMKQLEHAAVPFKAPREGH